MGVISGFNQQPNEFDYNQQESVKNEQFNNNNAKEFNPDDSNSSKKKESDSKLKAILTKVIAGTVAVTSTVVISSSVNNPVDTASAKILELSVSSTQIVYEIEATTASDLTLTLTNEHTRREAVIKNGENVGEFSNLKGGMKYLLKVTGSKGFGEKEILTKEIQTPISSVNAKLIDLRIHGSEIYYSIATNSKTPLTVTLTGGEKTLTNEFIPLELLPPNEEDGFNRNDYGWNLSAGGTFENLSFNTKYELTVTYKDENLKARELIKKQIHTPSIDLKVSLLEYGADIDYVYTYTRISPEIPYAVTLTDGTNVYTQRFTGSDEDYIEDGSGIFENLTPNTEYVLTITVDSDYIGDKEVIKTILKTLSNEEIL